MLAIDARCRRDGRKGAGTDPARAYRRGSAGSSPLGQAAHGRQRQAQYPWFAAPAHWQREMRQAAHPQPQNWDAQDPSPSRRAVTSAAIVTAPSAAAIMAPSGPWTASALTQTPSVAAVRINASANSLDDRSGLLRRVSKRSMVRTSPVSATMMPRLMQFWSGGLLVAAPMKLELRLNRPTGA